MTEPGEARRIYAAMRGLQRARIDRLGLDYILDRRENDRIYESLTEKNLRDGSAVLGALAAGDKVVAALPGIRCGPDFAMVRLAAAGGEWKRCSPGRLVIERTMRALHERGVRRFDFTIGDYPYKRRLGAVPKPLVEIISARSWRGLPEAGKARLKSFVRARPALAAAVKWLRGPSV